LGKPGIPYQSPTPFNDTGDYVVYFTSTDPSTKNDACTALPANTPDLSRRVVVVQRGTCDFNVKLANIGKAGGKIVLVYNSAGAIAIPQLNVGTTGLSNVGSLRREDGLRVSSFASFASFHMKGRQLTLSLPLLSFSATINRTLVVLACRSHSVLSYLISPIPFQEESSRMFAHIPLYDIQRLTRLLL